MMGYLDSATETFFFHIGWILFFLGLISCFCPHCFKKSVLLMLSGDFALMLAILFPKAFVDWNLFSLSFNYKVLGILGAFVIWSICIGTSLIRLFNRKNVNKRSNKNKEYIQKKNLNSEAKASPELFANVRKKAVLNSQDRVNFFEGVAKEER